MSKECKYADECIMSKKEKKGKPPSSYVLQNKDKTYLTMDAIKHTEFKAKYHNKNIRGGVWLTANDALKVYDKLSNKNDYTIIKVDEK